MNEQFITQLLGEGSLTIGGFVIIVGWLLSRRAASELGQARSMAREAIDAYKERTAAIVDGIAAWKGSQEAPQAITITGPIHVVNGSQPRSGEHHAHI